MIQFVAMRQMSDAVHLVTLSGGAGSWAAARRVRERYPEGRIVALFADTSMEDEDLYRFLPEAAASVGAELVRIADGRTPWDVFFDERFLGNSRLDPVMPERYAFHEQKEQEIRALLGDVSILKDRTGGGPKRPLTLRAFRERVERGASFDLFDIGGCGCAVA